jgi:CHAT domain-containing protein
VLTGRPLAAQPGAESLSTIEQADADAELARIEGFYRRSRYREAADLLERLLSRDGLSAGQRARTLARLAAARVELGQYDEALRIANQAEETARESGEDVAFIRVDVVRGSVWRFKGFPFRAVPHYERALARAEAAGLDTARAEVLNVLASVHQELGDWSRTLDYAQRAFEAVPDPSDAVRTSYLLHRGIALYEFGDGPGAEAAFSEMLALTRRVGNRRDEGLALGELGLVAWQFDGAHDRAIDLFERAIALARDPAVPILEATWLNNLGGVHRDAGRPDEALARYREALAIEVRTGQRRDRAALLKNMGQVLASVGRRDEAEPLLLEALAEADAQRRARIQWMARMELGGVYAGVDDAKAGRFFAESLDVLEAQQSSVLLDGFRAGMLGRSLSQYDPYDRYIQFLLARGEADKAFAVAERARARVFLETLAGARAELAAAVPETFVREEASILERITAGQARLRARDVVASERASILAAIDRAEEALTALRLRFEVEQPAAAHARFPRIWTAADLRRDVLQPDETLAMFFLGRDESVCWLLDRRGMQTVRLPPRAQIEEAVGRLLPTLQSPRVRVDEDARAWLSRTLIGPLIARAAEGTHLVIVPHAVLGYLPFEVLDAGGGRHVLERHTVSYAPSASSLAHLRRGGDAHRHGGAVVAIGNPVLATLPPSDEREGGALPWVGRLAPLPHSRAEIRRIGRTFRPHARTLEGRSATERALADAVAAGGIGILHFATHALLDEARPDRSGLVLSADHGGADGILQTREVYRLALPATLVTLSACETALGREITGEGIVGIARAFFYAGARAVTASLWSVSDRSTADLMAAFYERVHAGVPVDRALAEAKRARLRAGGADAHPYYWAPFIAMGHARVAMDFPSASGPWVPPWLVLAAAAAALAIALAFPATRRRRRSRPSRRQSGA